MSKITMRQVSKPAYKPELDGIRGIAIIAVLLTHAAVETPGLRLAGFSKFLKYLFTPGWAGVDLFFVLSGFLITGILLSTKTSDNYFRSFYTRRCLRIWPIYYMTLIALLVIGSRIAWIQSEISRPGMFQASYFFYLQNIPFFMERGSLGRIMGPFWSLAVEEQFYLVWPVLVLLLRNRALMWVCVAAFVLALPLRILLVRADPDDFRLMMLATSRIDGLVIGAACAIFMHENNKPIPRAWISSGGAMGALLIGYIALYHRHELLATSFYMYTIGITGFALLSGAVLATSQHHIPLLQNVLTIPWLKTFGKYSYGMYVYHMIVFLAVQQVVQRVFGLALPARFSVSMMLIAVMIALTFGIAKLSYNHFEVRFLALKRYFEPVANKLPAKVESTVSEA